MKIKILITLLFLGYFGFSQTVTLTLPNLKNEFNIKLEKDGSDDIIVSITDSEKKGFTGIVSKRGESVSAFTASVFSKIAETQQYYFKLKTADTIIKLTKDQLQDSKLHDAIVSEITNLDKKAFISLIKLKTKYTIDKISFTDYLKLLKQNNAIIPLFPNSSSDLQFKRIDENRIDLYSAGTVTPIINIGKEEDFYSQFYTHYCSIAHSQLIKDAIFTDGDVKSFDKNINYNTAANSAKLEEIFKQTAGKDSEYDFLDNYEITDAVSAKSYDFTVSIKNNFSRKYSVLKFCSSNYDCKMTSEIAFDIDHSKFNTKILNFLKDINNNYTITETDLALLHQKIKSYNEKKAIDENTKEYKKELSSIAEKLDNMATKYSGVLIMNKEIPVYVYIDKANTSKIQKGEINVKEALTKSDEKEAWVYKEVENIKFIVNDTTNSITFFNNKIKSINIVGYLNDNPEKKFSVSNNSYSIPLKSLNNPTHYIPIPASANDEKNYYISVNDLLDYGKSANVLSYSIKNKDYAISPNKNIKIEQRKLMDFFTAIIFSDVLGINSENPNSLLLAEGRIKVPLWLYNFRMVSFFNFLNADFNVSLYNGLDEKSRYIKPVNDGASVTVSQYIINNFDYIKYNNFNAGMSLNFVNVELKGLNSEWSLAGGVRYYRTGLRYTYINTGNADVIQSSQLNSLTYEISTNFEIRPQSNFGADINLGYNWLNARGSTDNIPIVFNPENNNDEKAMLRLQGNFYMKLDPLTSNDGIYVRMGGFYHLGSKDFYPQILVGYATNLSSFINGFKK